MNGINLLIDTNIVLYLLGGDTILSDVLDRRTIYLSFISELELLSYTRLTDVEEKVVRQFISDCIVVDINKEIKNKAVEIRRQHNLKLPDAIISGTAAYLKLPFMTSDKDFKRLDEINLIFYER